MEIKKNWNLLFLLQNNVMPNGEANITNNILEMMHADRHTVGHYRCTADNRVGQPDIRDIYVNVLCKFFFYVFYIYNQRVYLFYIYYISNGNQIEMSCVVQY